VISTTKSFVYISKPPSGGGSKSLRFPDDAPLLKKAVVIFLASHVVHETDINIYEYDT
jgi:hypothetical protein